MHVYKRSANAFGGPTAPALTANPPTTRDPGTSYKTRSFLHADMQTGSVVLGASLPRSHCNSTCHRLTRTNCPGVTRYNQGMRIYTPSRRSLKGASISRQITGPFRHRGTCVDDACAVAVDSMPDTGARLVGVASRSFTNGQPVTLDSVPQDALDAHVRSARALSQVGRLPYSAATCDSLAHFAETGVFRSPQVAQGIFWTLLGAMVLSVWLDDGR
jgi:hypothetical protein